MKRIVLAGLVAALLTGLALLGAAPMALGDGGMLGTGFSPSRDLAIDNEPDCEELLPDGMSIAGITDDGENVNLDVLVLLDGVDLQAAQQLLGVTQKSYTPMGITLRPTFQIATFTEVEGADLIAEARNFVGGKRPAGTDIVHVLTSKDLETGGNAMLAGQADCIGGVKADEHAFSIAEADLGSGIKLGPMGFSLEMGARVTAHELGHLLGAHHHYANCAEGASSSATRLEMSSCTLMFNVANFGVTNFSALNSTVVRAHAVDYARP